MSPESLGLKTWLKLSFAGQPAPAIAKDDKREKSVSSSLTNVTSLTLDNYDAQGAGMTRFLGHPFVCRRANLITYPTASFRICSCVA
jgi:hypothetical protein